MVYPRISRFIIILPFSKQPQRSFPDKVQTQISSQVQIWEIPMDSLPNLGFPMGFTKKKKKTEKNPKPYKSQWISLQRPPPFSRLHPQLVRQLGCRLGHGGGTVQGFEVEQHPTGTWPEGHDHGATGGNGISKWGVPYRFVNVFAQT